MEWVLIPLAAIGCGTAVVLTAIDKLFGGKKDAAKAALKAEQERARMLEAQLIETRRQNDQLQKQLEWHTKMLETQDRLMHRLSDAERPTVGAAS